MLAALTSSSARPWRFALVALSGALFLLLPPYVLLVEGPFSWHVAQPQSWQGGIEAIALMALLALAQLPARAGIRLLSTVVVAEIFLRRHDVDASIAVDILYFEIIFAIGGLARRLAGCAPARDTATYLRTFVLGLVVWSAFAWTASALGVGSLHDLRWLTLALGLASLASRQRPWIAHVHTRIGALSPAARAAAGALCAWVLVLFARASVVSGYDSLWYGLRGEYVLVGAGSAFKSLGLVSPVHYFPKLQELFLIPLSALGASTVLTGVTLMVLVLLAATAYRLLERLGLASPAVRFVAIGFCLTIPAIANSALDAKSDLLAALLMMLAWLVADAFLERRRASDALWLLGLLVLATQAKLTALPFGGALALATALAWWRTPVAAPAGSDAPERRLATAFFVLVLFVTTLLTARTLLLAGMPTIGPDPLFHLWQKLGFELKPPAGTLGWTFPANASAVPELAYDLLFRPQRLGHGVITWIGNGWLWCGLVALMGAGRAPHGETRTRIRWLAAGLIAMGAYLQFGVGYLVRGGDGNYFIVALIPLALVGFSAAWRALSDAPAARVLFLVLAGAMTLMQMSYGFVSAAWTPGTRAFDTDFSRSARAFRKLNMKILRADGLGRIATELRATRGTARAVGYLRDEIGMRLPASYEGLVMVGYSRPEYLTDGARFLDYLARNRIDFVILPKASDAIMAPQVQPAVAATMQVLAADPRVHVLDDEGYVMFELAQYHAASAAGRAN